MPEFGLKAASKSFWFENFVTTHGGFDVSVPVHAIKGAHEGPTVLIQAGLSGLEVEPALTLPGLVNEINPEDLSGTLLLVPLFNMSGFEFEQENLMWDNKNLHSLSKGRTDGTVSEVLVHRYFEKFVKQADLVLEIRTGAQWSYGHYVSLFKGATPKAYEVACRLGVPQVLTNVPFDDSMLAAATSESIAAVTAWIGGGPGLRDFREEDVACLRSTVFNALHAMGMLSEVEQDTTSQVNVLKQLCAISSTSQRGLVFMHQELRGRDVNQGDELGLVKHPFTGEVLERITAPQKGVVLDAGASWPMVPEGTVLAILGHPVEV